MGQKVRPTGFRTGIMRPWRSTWYASKNDFSELLLEDNRIRTFIQRYLTNKKDRKEQRPAIADIRTAIFALRAHDVSETGLRHRLLGLVSGFTPLPRITFAGPLDLVVTDDLADDLLAVVRESLANIARHANASFSSVALLVSEAEVVVTIEDDGVGPPSHPRPSGTAPAGPRARRGPRRSGRPARSPGPG